jgi:hypothetical protein
MHRTRGAVNSTDWQDYVPRPVLVLLVYFEVYSPLRLVPISDFLRTEVEMTLPQMALAEPGTKWVVSVQDDSNDEITKTSLLPILEDDSTIRLDTQLSTSEVLSLDFSVSSTKTEVSKTGICDDGQEYSSYKEVKRNSHN